MSSSMSLLPLLPLVLLLLTTQTYSSSSPKCDPFMCGNINISYPFSRYDKTAEHCGLPGFLVSCEYNKTPILHLNSDNYTVLDINYENYTITLVDTDVLDKTCPRVQHNVSLFTNSGISYTSSDVNLVFFFHCNTNAYNGVIDSSPISCLIPENGDSFVFDSNTLRSDAALYSLTNICSEVVVAHVLEDSLKQNSSDLNTYFGKALQSGFQLGWDDSTKNCTQCQKNLGQCGYSLLDNNTTYNFNCFCPNGSCDRSKKKRLAAVIGAPMTAAVALLFLFSALFFLYMRRKRQENLILSSSNYAIKVKNVIGERKKEDLIEVTLENFGSLAPKKYSFSKIRKITNFFNQKIGQGGYASVFKGELMDGSPVAVKVFKDSESTGKEFISEVMSIARTSHVNIVRLLGFSINGSKRVLIYEFMSNGSLDKYLRESQNSTLSDVECTRLFDIAIGIARGLEYLHRGCNTRIVHFDIKPHNILLDEDYCPKISDFGLAKFCQPKESIIPMSGMRGTIGYIAPEVFSRNFGSVSSKSDVYSYGMMLLKMFVEKQGQMKLKDFSSTETYFPDYIYKCIEQNNICSVYGISDVSEEVVRKATIVGLCCIQMMPQLRPTMSEVLDMLAKSVEELTLPPSSNVTLASVLVQDVADTTASISYDH